MEAHAEEGQALLRVLEVATLCALPMALKAAVQLNVMDILAQHAGPGGFLSPAQIAEHFPTSLAASTATNLNRILRLLASHGLLSSSVSTCPDGTPLTSYGLIPSSSFLMHTPHGSLSPFLLTSLDPRTLQPLFTLHESVLDGSVPLIKAHGVSPFTYFQHDTALGHLFHIAMGGLTQPFMQALLATYRGFDNISSLVDVGGGVGTAASMIVAKHPHIKCINFDQEYVIEKIPTYPGVEHVGGDMFEEIPQANAIFMKNILHNWSDDHCLKLLANCYKALPRGGKVIVVDSILPSKVECDLPSHVSYQMDFLMFAFTEGGKERTKEELDNLAKVSGFKNLQLICNLHGLTIVELSKGTL